MELTGAVARPFMLMYDDLYKKRVRKAGIEIKMYERYIDDSNQVAVVPPPGSRYDEASKKVIIDEELADEHENDDDRLTKILVALQDMYKSG